jgi:hypothetical protein
MGNPIALRTLSISASNGSRTLGSVLTGGNNGAGSSRRIYNYYKTRGATVTTFYKDVFDLTYGEYRDLAYRFI